MGFYLRKSISVGPIRFNLSKSGVGVSAGVRGLRVGSGPRGNYVHMGRGGLYYRATLLSGSPSAQSVRPQPVQQAAPTIPPGTHEQLQEIDSVDATQISDIGSRELLAELDAKSKRGRLLPWVIGAGAIALFFGAQAAWPPWAFLLTLALTAVAAYAAHTWDALAKTVVVFYELDATCEVLYT